MLRRILVWLGLVLLGSSLGDSYDGGPYDTVPVGQYPQGQSPYGVLDMAGQVFEWTSTLFTSDPPRYVVKGGAWDDLPGVTRTAARHGRPAALKHVLMGFRCAHALADSIGDSRYGGHDERHQ